MLRISIFVALLALGYSISPFSYSDRGEAVVVEPDTSKRSTERQFVIEAFGQKFELDLHENKDLLPENLPVKVYTEGDVEDWTHRTSGKQQLLVDRAHGASLLVDDAYPDGSRLTGLIGDHLYIEPETNIDLDLDTKRETSHVTHVVYRLKAETEVTTKSDFVEVESEDEQEDKVAKRALPEYVYVPVHVVVDYSLNQKLNRGTAEIIQYVKIFYNSVNSLYSSMTWPTPIISIQGITICSTSSACSMVENSKLSTTAVNAKTALDDISVYAYDKKSSTGENYAIMMVMTDYDLCSADSSGICQPSTAGLAFVGTACGKYSFSKTMKVGISEDHSSFDGIKTVSHEIGHLLGMNHDGDGASSGGPGGRNCRWSDNYIMGQTAFVLNQWKWSSCSAEQLRWLASQSKASCLLQKPSSTTYSLINKLPGKVLDLDNQCKIQHGSTSGVGCREPGINSGNDLLCLGLMCTTSSGRCSSSTAPAEGSYCGPQRYCLQGKCVCDPSAPLPTVPPRDPNCKGDNSRILISGKSCVDLLSSADGLKSCTSNLVDQYCCESKYKYCRATPISCDGSAVPTQKPTAPNVAWTSAPKTTLKQFVPAKDNCGATCEDTPNIRIDGQYCTDLLATSSGKTNFCDNPVVVEHCCKTRQSVCNGYHWITESCDSSCQDNALMKINGKYCVQFLGTTTDRENYCDAAITQTHCCATKSKVCGSSAFGKK